MIGLGDNSNLFGSLMSFNRGPVIIDRNKKGGFAGLGMGIHQNWFTGTMKKIGEISFTFFCLGVSRVDYNRIVQLILYLVLFCYIYNIRSV